MPRRSLPILLVLLAVIAIGVVWLVGTLRVETAPVSEVAAALPRPDRAESAASAPAPALADAPAPIRPAAADIESTSPAAAREAIEKGEEDIDMTDAWTVEGRVQFPAGVPADERVQVLACVGKSLKLKVHSRSDLAPDGSFRVSFARSAAKGRLVLEARYLYLSIAHEISPDDLAKLANPIVLRPELGGCIRGRLVLAPNALDHRESLVGTEIHLGSRSRADPRDHSNNIQREAKIGSELEFEFGGLPRAWIYDVYIHPKSLVDASAENLDVEPGRLLAVDLEIRLGARVSGRVVDEQGAPVEGVEIGMRIQRGANSTGSSGDHETAADGSFTVAGIQPGKVTLNFSKTGFSFLEDDLGLLADGESRPGLEKVLRRGLTVTGRVLWPDGRPGAGARIAYQFAREQGSKQHRYFRTESAEITAGEDGAFEISGLESHKITITAQAEVDDGTPPATEAKKVRKPKNSSWKAHLDGVAPGTRDLVITLGQSVAIRGRAVDDEGAALAAFQVRAEPVDGSQEWERRQRAQTTAGKSGEFVLEGLHDGEWDLVAEARQHASSTSQRIRLPRQDEEIVFVLPRGATVSGVIVDRAGKPVRGAKAAARAADAASRFKSWNQEDRSARSDGEGRFQIEGISPGPVKVVATAEGMAASVPLPIELAPGQVESGLTLALRLPGRITGEVLDDAGRPMPGRPVYSSGMAEQIHQETETDASGRFEFEGVTPDRYWVNSQASQEELEALALDEDESQVAWTKNHKQGVADVQEGQTTHIVLGGMPKDGVRVHGTIYAGAARDRTVAGCTLWIHRQKSEDPSPITGTSDAQGRYEVVVPAAGEYSVSAWNEKAGTTNSTKLTVPEGKELQHDIVLPGGRIAGRVIGLDGEPAANVHVSCTPEQSKAALSGSASYGNATTDEGGRFAFDGMNAGTYRLEAGAQEWQKVPGVSGKSVRGGIALEADGRIENVELRLQPQCRVEGVVVGPDGRPAAGATVYARDELGNVLQRWPPTSADASGRFTMEGILPGKVTFAARTKSLSSAESAPVTARAEETAKVQLELRSGTRLRVIVRGSDDRVVGAFTTIEDASGRDVTVMYAYQSLDFFGEAREGEGQLIGPVPPGRYRLTATNHDRVTASQEVSVSGEPEVAVTIRLGG
ncbi:MAG: carboxypeptidase regulatory-like domain-containing protein [Planctomycetota bacterium]